jgi:hypothetical protein
MRQRDQRGGAGVFVFASRGMLSYGFPESSVDVVIEAIADLIAVDAGSTDRGAVSPAASGHPQQGCRAAAAVAKRYKVSPNEITGFEFHPFANAVKFSLRRPVVAGAIGDRHVYGAQQHAPLLDLEVA